MGDMPFLNKLVGLKSGIKAAHQCWICNIHADFLDDPYKKSTNTDTRTIAQKTKLDPKCIKEIGYNSIKDNIFHQLTFCHNYGVNMSTPVEPLHGILLGLFIRLMQGFNHLRRLRKENSTNQGDPYLVFTGVYKDVVECDLKTIEFLLKQHLICHIHTFQDDQVIFLMQAIKMITAQGRKWHMNLDEFFWYC